VEAESTGIQKTVTGTSEMNGNDGILLDAGWCKPNQKGAIKRSMYKYNMHRYCRKQYRQTQNLLTQAKAQDATQAVLNR